MKYLLILLLLITSCSRKVTTSKSSMDYTHSVSTIKDTLSSNSYTSFNTIDSATYNSTYEFVIAPIDSSKVMVVDGMTYTNASLRLYRTSSGTMYQKDSKVSQRALFKAREVHTDSTTVKQSIMNKKTSKTDYSWLVVGLVLGMLLFRLIPREWINKR